MQRRAFLMALTAALATPAFARDVTSGHVVKAAKITLLSTMLADGDELGEWGFSALVEVDGRAILFDTGTAPDLVLKNAAILGIDLSRAEDVILSHNHADHTGGLLTLRRELMAKNPLAMGRAHVSAGIFTPRLTTDGKDDNGLSPLKAQYEAMGGQFIVHEAPAELMDGVWFTGPVPRPHDETNWQPGLTMRSASGAQVQDNVPEDAALLLATADGTIILTGCGHAGIVNIGDYARKLSGNAPVLAVVGGLHLFSKTDAVVDWTGAQLKAMGVRYLLAAHCTGIEATWRLRQDMGLTRATAVVGATGASFTLGKGIDPGDIAR